MPTEAPPEAEPTKGPPPAPLPETGGSARGVAGGVPGGVEGGVVGGTGTAAPAALTGGDAPIDLPEDATPAELPTGIDVHPEYPEVARATGKEGLVILKVVVKRDGSVGAVKVLRGEPPFVEAAVAWVKGVRFRPAMQGGAPIATFKVLKIPFKLSVGG